MTRDRQTRQSQDLLRPDSRFAVEASFLSLRGYVWRNWYAVWPFRLQALRHEMCSVTKTRGVCCNEKEEIWERLRERTHDHSAEGAVFVSSARWLLATRVTDDEFLDGKDTCVIPWNSSYHSSYRSKI
jgi:hypothetical protein